MAISKSSKGKSKQGNSRSDKSKSPLTSTKTEKSMDSKAAKIDPNDFAFGRINFIIMIGGICLIILGYVLMAGGKSSTPEEFNPEIFSFQRITLAPLLVLAGLIVQVWAIVKKAD